MLQIKINGDKIISGSIENGTISLNGEQQHLGIAPLENNCFHILKNNKSFVCEVLSDDPQKKAFRIKVNGNILDVAVQDRFDVLLHKMGMDKVAVFKVNTIKAPMPGLILKIMVSPGQEINTGDSLLILEAMKMENIIKSPGAGIIKTIHVKERDAIEKQQILIELK